MTTPKLPNSIVSSEDLKSAIAEIKRYASWFSAASIKARVTGKPATEQLEINDAAKTLILAATEGNLLTQKILDELITALEAQLASAPRVTITLAGVPSGGLKKSLAAWCRLNMSPIALVDVRFNATILGGMVVQYGSHIYDWSFRRQILTARHKFPEVLRHV